ncbi:MAG: hypothetical protein JWP97_1621 [Labilithrix sp.]|nr:hypothetical protein [Labilithrix sp.]
MKHPDRLHRVLAGSSLAAILVACADVPALRFGPEDAGATNDGGPADGGADDAAVDAAGDGPPAPACTGVTPSGGKCCGTVFCVGTCEAAGCAACEAAGCAVGEVCCAKQGTVQCKAKCP